MIKIKINNQIRYPGGLHSRLLASLVLLQNKRKLELLLSFGRVRTNNSEPRNALILLENANQILHKRALEYPYTSSFSMREITRVLKPAF